MSTRPFIVSCGQNVSHVILPGGGEALSTQRRGGEGSLDVADQWSSHRKLEDSD